MAENFRTGMGSSAGWKNVFNDTLKMPRKMIANRATFVDQTSNYQTMGRWVLDTKIVQ